MLLAGLCEVWDTSQDGLVGPAELTVGLTLSSQMRKEDQTWAGDMAISDTLQKWGSGGFGQIRSFSEGRGGLSVLLTPGSEGSRTPAPSSYGPTWCSPWLGNSLESQRLPAESRQLSLMGVACPCADAWLFPDEPSALAGRTPFLTTPFWYASRLSLSAWMMLSLLGLKILLLIEVPSAGCGCL
ncbi:hypothetical protein P7K49_003160 [Saguinus oedipus]|uniref:Uncharacterized protein n=1 Tax=Saguinus oedipus TaxID=9490 RepID=A0ABQ9WJD4_SAGOE|nr:hypothetical protein P7K49_003160 [Saguinus oedipus]